MFLEEVDLVKEKEEKKELEENNVEEFNDFLQW